MQQTQTSATRAAAVTIHFLDKPSGDDANFLYH